MEHKKLHKKLHKLTAGELENELKSWMESVEPRHRDEQRIDDLLEEISQRWLDEIERNQDAWLSVQK